MDSNVRGKDNVLDVDESDLSSRKEEVKDMKPEAPLMSPVLFYEKAKLHFKGGMCQFGLLLTYVAVIQARDIKITKLLTPYVEVSYRKKTISSGVSKEKNDQNLPVFNWEGDVYA